MIKKREIEILLKYSVIRNNKQYKRYCDRLKALIFNYKTGKRNEYEINLLMTLTEKYDLKFYPVTSFNSVELLNHLIEDHKLNQVTLAKELNIDVHEFDLMIKGKKPISDYVDLKLTGRFKIRRKTFLK